jgi:hypothetical protein
VSPRCIVSPCVGQPRRTRFFIGLNMRLGIAMIIRAIYGNIFQSQPERRLIVFREEQRTDRRLPVDEVRAPGFAAGLIPE